MKNLLFIILALFSGACAIKKEQRKEQKDVVITEQIKEQVKETLFTEETKTEEKTKDSNLTTEEKSVKEFIETAETYIKIDPDGTKHEFKNYNKNAKENKDSKASEIKKEKENITTDTDIKKDTEVNKETEKKEVDNSVILESKNIIHNINNHNHHKNNAILSKVILVK